MNDLVPLAVDLEEKLLSIRLVAVWDSGHPAAALLESLARRLGTFVRERYGRASE